MVQSDDCGSISLSGNTSELTIPTWMDMGFQASQLSEDKTGGVRNFSSHG